MPASVNHGWPISLPSKVLFWTIVWSCVAASAFRFEFWLRSTAYGATTPMSITSICATSRSGEWAAKSWRYFVSRSSVVFGPGSSVTSIPVASVNFLIAASSHGRSGLPASDPIQVIFLPLRSVRKPCGTTIVAPGATLPAVCAATPRARRSAMASGALRPSAAPRLIICRRVSLPLIASANNASNPSENSVDTGPTSFGFREPNCLVRRGLTPIASLPDETIGSSRSSSLPDRDSVEMPTARFRLYHTTAIRQASAVSFAVKCGIGILLARRVGATSPVASRLAPPACALIRRRMPRMAKEEPARGTLRPATAGGAAAMALPALRPSGGVQRWIRQHWLDVALVTPLFLYILFFMLIPVVESIWFSFVLKGTHHLTLANYRTIVNRSQFKDAFFNTIGITLMGVAMEMVAGMIIALMLARGFRGRGVFRTIVLVPLGVPTLVAGAAML